MAVYGPESTRVQAAKVADRLVAAGADIPDWTLRLGQVKPARVLMLSDAWDDSCSIHLDCVRDGETVGVGVSIDAIGGLIAHGFVYGPTTEWLEEFVTADPDTFVTEVNPADARATVEAGLAVADETTDLYLQGADADNPDPDLRALIQHRFSLLPAGGTSLRPYRDLDTMRSEVMATFLARPGVADLPDAENLADTLWDFAGYCDGDPLCWSPTRVETFLGIWVPAKVVAADEWCRGSYAREPPRPLNGQPGRGDHARHDGRWHRVDQRGCGPGLARPTQRRLLC